MLARPLPVIINPFFYLDERVVGLSPLALRVWVESFSTHDAIGVMLIHPAALRCGPLRRWTCTDDVVLNALKELMDKNLIYGFEHKGDGYFLSAAFPAAVKHQYRGQPPSFRYALNTVKEITEQSDDFPNPFFITEQE